MGQIIWLKVDLHVGLQSRFEPVYCSSATRRRQDLQVALSVPCLAAGDGVYGDGEADVCSADMKFAKASTWLSISCSIFSF